MAETNKVIARFLDGRIIRGSTDDFFTGRPGFHLHPIDGGPRIDVQCKLLKAVFFVRDFGGDPHRSDHGGFPAGPGDPNLGRKVAVQFKDGEVLCGYTLTYSAERNGFFLNPAFPSTNNLRIYVLAHAAREIGVGLKADQVAARDTRRKAA